MKKVLVGGCFDFIHFGHIAFLEAAKKQGDWLVVALESDENVRRMKGETRPIHTQVQRKAMLESLRCVNEVISLPPLKTDAGYAKMVTDIQPAVIAITQGDSMENKKRSHAQLIGARIVAIPKTQTPSTSQLAKVLGLE